MSTSGVTCAPGLLLRPGPRDAQFAAGAQTRDQLALQCAAALDVERLIDCLVADPHELIIREVGLEPVGDLLRAPALHPASVGAVRLALAVPLREGRAEDPAAAGVANLASESLLHVVAQPLVGDQLGELRSARTTLGMPLGDAGLVVEVVGPRRCVAKKLPRDRRRIPPDLASDLTNTSTLRPKQSDVLALGEGQIAAGHRRRQARIHAASVAKPAEPDRARHACLGARVLGLGATSDHRPEPHPILAPGNCRATR
jgi:hypothetical protein